MRQHLQKHSVIFFFVFTFVIAWFIWIPVGVFAPALFLPAILLGAWSPTLSALILTGLIEGRAGLKTFIRRLFLWRVGWHWYGVVLFSVAAILIVAVAIDWLAGGGLPKIVLPAGVPPEHWYVALPLLFIINIFVGGPLAEDIGWRGYILPKLGARVGLLNASLIIGVIWALWHLPFFLLPQGAQVVGGIPFIWFALLTTGWSVLFAWVFTNTRESILLPVLYHAAINTTLSSTDALGFVGGTGNWQLLVINVLVTWLVVLVIAFRFGPTLRGRSQPTQTVSETVAF